jgi:hypothetical protein
MPTEVKGAIALRKSLREFAPELGKQTQKEIANFLKPVVRQARGYMPSNGDVPSGWVLGTQKGKWTRVAYDAGIARRGIGYKTTPSKANRRGFSALASILNKSAAGAIYETAGRKSGIQGRFTPRLNGQLVGEGQKMTGRAMFRAYEEDQGKAKAAVIQAIFNSARKLNMRASRG